MTPRIPNHGPHNHVTATTSFDDAVRAALEARRVPRETPRSAAELERIIQASERRLQDLASDQAMLEHEVEIVGAEEGR